MIEEKLLPYIVHGLTISNPFIRAAACNCAKSLSRSVKNLRTHLMDAGIAEPLFNLLFDPEIDVQIKASAALCNIVLDFSPMKDNVIRLGGIRKFIELLNSLNSQLRLNAVWALKNMLFQTTIDIKLAVMKELTWDGLF